jgi:YVTN family beta-propeller protein
MLSMKNLIFILLFTLCACAPTPSQHSIAYITNQGDNTVSVIDIQQNKVINTIKVGKAPVGVAVSTKLKRVFISNVESGDISVIDSAINKVIESIAVQGSPVGLAMAPDYNTLYVADWFSDRIIAISTADYTKRREVMVAKAPAGLVVSNDSNTLYVAARDSNEVAVVDTKSFAVIKRIAAGTHPFGISINKDTLYVVNVYDNTISAINTQTWAESKIKVGEHPYCVVSSADNKTLYVTNTQDDTVSVIDLGTHKTVAVIDVGMTPEGISYDTANKLVLAASWGENKVSVIDARTNTLKDHINTGDKSRAFGQFILPEQ